MALIACYLRAPNAAAEFRCANARSGKVCVSAVYNKLRPLQPSSRPSIPYSLSDSMKIVFVTAWAHKHPKTTAGVLMVCLNMQVYEYSASLMDTQNHQLTSVSMLSTLPSQPQRADCLKVCSKGRMKMVTIKVTTKMEVT